MFLGENKDCDYDVTGINAQYGYGIEHNDDPCRCDKATKNKLLNEIRCLYFAITDLAEYLNTHPNDKRAICLHNEYCKKLEDLKEKYQRVYGPLTIYYPCNKWRWLEDPWPWEGSDD